MSGVRNNALTSLTPVSSSSSASTTQVLRQMSGSNDVSRSTLTEEQEYELEMKEELAENQARHRSRIATFLTESNIRLSIQASDTELPVLDQCLFYLSIADALNEKTLKFLVSHFNHAEAVTSALCQMKRNGILNDEKALDNLHLHPERGFDISRNLSEERVAMLRARNGFNR